MNPSPQPVPAPPADFWQRDEALRRTADLIDRSAGRVRAVSFDFFDTLVWRLAAKPTDVFFETGRRLLEARLLPAAMPAADFDVLRRRGEMKARDHQNRTDASREDISISDIYSQLKAVVKDPAMAAGIEHETECDFCQLNPLVAGFIGHLLGRGLKVLIVSDIYLSAAQLREILRRRGFDPDRFALVLTSSDEGVCKGTGNLFRRALQALQLEPGQMIHVGDNFLADVTGARKAGVRGCHYPQAAAGTRTILDRERFLLAGQTPVFSISSLRLLAARLFPGDTPEAFFSRAGAFLMGPVLARYAGWACEQFVAGGVRKVGALMREGELFGELLQREARVRGLDLEITPLYINRRATDLAAIGQLTANNLIAWLQARPTLSVKAILTQFGLEEADFRHAPLALDEKADQQDKILRLAKFLFTPKIARRIEAKSAEERRKVLDYLRPWLAGGEPFGVCDIGYSASAQTQLKKILEMEKLTTPVIGCYLVSYERAADRVLDGVDIRHFLGNFGYPDISYHAFIRSPAFMEQSLVASIGTTLGYERRADGSVAPVLDRTPYDDAMIRRQQSFKQGVLEFQMLWHQAGRQCPALLADGTEFSRRLLAEIDRDIVPVLGRATAFPLQEEVKHFGSLALDDCYFADAYKPLCGEKDLETLRTRGLGHIMAEPGIHWPHGVFHRENPQTAREFFSIGKSLLLCKSDGDDDGVKADLSVILPSGRNPAVLGECLARLKAVADRSLRLEVIVMVPPGDKVMIAAVNDLSRRVLPVLLFERAPLQTLFQQMNLAADSASAPLLLFIDEGVRLSPGWDEPLLRTLRSAADIGVVLPVAFPTPKESPAAVPPVPRCFLVRRPLFAEGLGFSEDFAMAGGVWNFLLALRQLNYRTVRCPDVTLELRPAETAGELTPENLQLLSRRWPDFPRQAAELAGLAALAPEPAAPVAVDWTGSFLDHGSLSQVNRELTAVLQSSPKVRLQRVSNGAAAAPGFESLAREIAPAASAAPAVTVRHAWPPDWRRPARGKLVVIQPWEFGLLPAEWVQQSAQVDEFWVPSDYVRQVYAESGVPAGKVVVVPNGVNPQRFHPQAAPAKLATTKRFKFLFVGGTIFRKGPDVLLQAYLANFTAADEVCLVIKDFGGRSVYAGQTFEAKIRAAQAQPNAPEILYINEELPPDDLPGIYTACDCLVLPYRGEGFGLPVLEAMACGRPVIVTSGGATDDFVRDDFAWRIPARRQIFGHEISGLKLAGAGWLLEPDAEALGRFLREAVAQPGETRRRGERAAQHARQFFTWAQAGAFAAQRLQALGRALPETATVPAPQAAPAAPVKITLPPAALIGHLAGARDLLRQKKARAAWEAVLAALAKRPFHPEAYLLLAEIALTVGAGRIARLCAEHARHLAPDWKPAKKLLNQRFNGTAQPEWLKLPAELPTPEAERRPRLTVCLIVKNEEKFLGRCLDSVRGLASQIVVVDTGSTDRTVAIALEHGAEIHEFAWTDDFSAARNAALEHATGDWVLMLDADEELTAEGREKLPLAMANPAVMAWRLPLMDVGREANGFTYVPRFYRNAPALFYLGRVHEQVFSSVEVRCAEWGLANRIGDAPLIHHGYTDAMMRDRNKVARNLRLLERAIEELPGEPHLLMHLGLELTRSGRATEGLERDLEAFTILSARPAREVVPELRETLLMQVGAHLTAARRFDEVARVLTSPLAELGGGLTASLHFSLGLAQFELRRFREAADQMRQCLAKRLQPTCTSINQEIKTAAPHLCLAMCLDRAGDPAGTEAAYQAGLAETGLDTSLRREYARWLAGQNRLVEALQQLHQLVTQQNQDLAAWQLGGQIALSRPQFLKFARDWTEEALQRRPEDPLLLAQRAEVLLLSEDLAAALPLWEQLWVQTAQPGALAALILCETVEALTTHAPDEGTEEAAVSRAFIQWYRKLLAVKGQKTMMRLNAQTEKLGRALPMAARMLDAAMGEAARAAA